MRAVAAIALAALTGLSGFAATACALLPILMTVLIFFDVTPDRPSDKATAVIISVYSILPGLFAAAVFSMFAWLCWRLVNIIWPNRMVTG